jgi:type IV secretion system protein VirB3
VTGGSQHIAGFEATIHASLGSPILLAGAPRALAIVNGTIAAAIALGLQQWVAGLVLWATSQTVCVLAARRDPDFARVLIRHLGQNGYLAC